MNEVMIAIRGEIIKLIDENQLEGVIEDFLGGFFFYDIDMGMLLGSGWTDLPVLEQWERYLKSRKETNEHTSSR